MSNPLWTFFGCEPENYPSACESTFWPRVIDNCGISFKVFFATVLEQGT